MWPPPLLRLVVAAVVVFAAWQQRGIGLAVFAVLLCAVVQLGTTSAARAPRPWSRRRTALDASIMGPIVFLALAMLTTLPLGVCVAVGLACAAIFVPSVVALRSRPAQ
jgi:hypothetical protein